MNPGMQLYYPFPEKTIFAQMIPATSMPLRKLNRNYYIFLCNILTP